MGSFGLVATLMVVFAAVGSGQVLHSKYHTVSSNVGQIRGKIDNDILEGRSVSVTKFLGIPFGETTAGVNRYRKPIPKANFTSVYDATYPRAACSQQRHNPNYTYSEDCLYLNVYVPADMATSHRNDYPVMIWVHGGAFVVGTSYSYYGDALSTYGDVIVVTVNYRLGRFGFLTTKDSEAPGNYGLWDQHLAFSWVHNNIQAFGGDRNEVTIFGESAGAASVLLQALYPGNKGLFKRVIAESGAGLSYWAVRNKANSAQLIQGAGCDSVVAKVDCLRTKSGTQLEAIKLDPATQFAPTVDGEFLPELPQAIVKGNNGVSSAAKAFFSSLDVLTGVNSMDGALYVTSVWAPRLGIKDLDKFAVTQSEFVNNLVPWSINDVYSSENNQTKTALEKALIFEYTDWEDVDNANKTRDNLVKISSDVAFFTGAIDTVREHARLAAVGRSTYLYEFTTVPTHRALPTPNWISGANHADEIQFVFGASLQDSTKSLTSEQLLAKSMMSLWTNFAISGDPNKPRHVTSLINTTWPQYDMTSQAFLELSTHMSPASVKHRFAARSAAFWLDLVPAILDASCRNLGNVRPSVNPAAEIIG